MATILEFRGGSSRPSAQEGTAFAGAQIIIFPGVRRERHEDPPRPRRRDKDRVKRDRLELAE